MPVTPLPVPSADLRNVRRHGKVNGWQRLLKARLAGGRDVPIENHFRDRRERAEDFDQLGNVAVVYDGFPPVDKAAGAGEQDCRWAGGDDVIQPTATEFDVPLGWRKRGIRIRLIA